MIRRYPAWISPLDEPVPIGPIVYFRIVLGLAMLVWATKILAGGLVDLLYLDPAIHFTYPLFHWAAPLPGPWMRWEVVALAIASIGVAVGFAYRVCAFVVAVAFTHVFLIDKALYQNHYYLMCLLAWIAVLLPAHRALSIDSLLRPSIRTTTVRAWTLWLLRFQIAVPYIYGGIAKLDGDWLRGQPIRATLAAGTDSRLIGPFLNHEWCIWLVVYGGLLFDLLVVPALFWNRTRPLAFVLALAFHLTNAMIFNIGVFPWLMGLLTVVFFPPDLLQRLMRLDYGAGIGAAQSRLGFPSRARFARTGYVLLAAYVVIQLVVPLRHFAYPGPANWTEQGHYFSWRMKLRGKMCALRVFATDPTSGHTGAIDLRHYVRDHQTARLAREPAMIHQLCQFTAADLAERGHPGVEIRAWSLVGLNGRKPQLLIDPAVDLAHESAPGFGCKWIVPLTEPLRREAWNIPLHEWEQHFRLPEPLAERLVFSMDRSKVARTLSGGATEEM